MTTVCTASDISILCDCPYAGKTREIKGSEGNEEKRRQKLQNEIKRTKGDLIVTRTVLVDTRRKLAALRRIINMELGCVMNPYVMTQTTWKDRVREQSYLKSELVHLIDYLRECDPRNITDLAVHPMKLSTSTEDLLLAKQEMTLKDLYHGYTVYLSDNEKRAGSCLRDFLQLKENYEKKLYCNKILEQDITLTKKRIGDLQRQFLEDKCLIDFISNHHFKMKGTFSDSDLGENGLNKENAKTDCGDSEAEKFKKLWEQSRMEKNELTTCLQALKKKIEFADQKIIRAENVCSQNIVACRNFALKMKEKIPLLKVQPKQKDNFGKFSLIQYRSQRSQLDAAESENRYLRNFLSKTVLSKTDHLKQLQHSLQSTAEKYRLILESVRNSLVAPAVMEVKDTKKKKK